MRREDGGGDGVWMSCGIGIGNDEASYTVEEEQFSELTQTPRNNIQTKERGCTTEKRCTSELDMCW